VLHLLAMILVGMPVDKMISTAIIHSLVIKKFFTYKNIFTIC